MNSISLLSDVRRGQLSAQVFCRDRQIHPHHPYPLRTASKRRSSDCCIQFPSSANHTFISLSSFHSMGEGSFSPQTSASN